MSPDKIYLGFVLPNPGTAQNSDTSTPVQVLVINTDDQAGERIMVGQPKPLPHLCQASSPRARSFVSRYGCHSPSGFSWGYSGSGPAELALMILLDMGLLDDAAWRYHQQVKSALISNLPQGEPWQLSESQIRQYLHETTGLDASRLPSLSFHVMPSPRHR